MGKGVGIEVSPADKARPEAIVAARCSRQKYVWRARILLLTEHGLGMTAITAAMGKSKTCVALAGTRHGRRCRGVAAQQDPASGHCHAEARSG